VDEKSIDLYHWKQNFLDPRFTVAQLSLRPPAIDICCPSSFLEDAVGWYPSYSTTWASTAPPPCFEAALKVRRGGTDL